MKKLKFINKHYNGMKVACYNAALDKTVVRKRMTCHLCCPVASEVVPLHAQPLHQIDALHQAAAPKEGQQHVRGHLDLRRARLPVM